VGEGVLFRFEWWKALIRLRNIFWFVLIGVLLGASSSALAAVHLLGFVEVLCADETGCFELRVEKEYVAVAGKRITVRFDRSTKIFDPENYELTLEQSNIIEGSHLRLLLNPYPGGSEHEYRALYIWIGD
jgi:hypothetical protein